MSLHKGNVIAIPTDTIYGIAADATDKDAIQKLYDIKSRDTDKPISIAVGNLQDVYNFAFVSIPDELLSKLLPGPYTLLFKKKGLSHLNPTSNLIGVRIPDSKFVKAIASEIGAIALTSANLSGEISPLCISDFEEIHHLIDVIFDAGTIESNQRDGSTIVNLVDYPHYTIIRKGQGYNELIKLLS